MTFRSGLGVFREREHLFAQQTLHAHCNTVKGYSEGKEVETVTGTLKSIVSLGAGAVIQFIFRNVDLKYLEHPGGAI